MSCPVASPLATATVLLRTPAELQAYRLLACNRFVNVATLNPVQQRNAVDKENYMIEFLMHAKFHETEADTLGYATIAWTPVRMIDHLPTDEVVANMIDEYTRDAAKAAREAFPSVACASPHPSPPQCEWQNPNGYSDEAETMSSVGAGDEVL